MTWDLEQRLLYRDALMLIIDKPAGLPVHAGPKGGEHLGLYLDQLRFGLPKAPELAHRLDKDTSGCLVLGRHRKALDMLGKLFSSNRITKTYWAIVDGTPPQEEGRIDLPLGKKSNDPRSWWMMVDKENGQQAITDYRVLGTQGALTWLELKPLTGRTHQLRVHCAGMGFPIVGDAIYGDRETARQQALCLHARQIEVPLHSKKPAVVAVAEPPEHMKTLLDAFQ